MRDDGSSAFMPSTRIAGVSEYDVEHAEPFFKTMFYHRQNKHNQTSNRISHDDDDDDDDNHPLKRNNNNNGHSLALGCLQRITICVAQS